MKFALLIIGNIRLNDPKTPPNLGGVFGSLHTATDNIEGWKILHQMIWLDVKCVEIAFCSSFHHAASGQCVTNDYSLGEYILELLQRCAIGFGTERQYGEVTGNLDGLAV